MRECIFLLTWNRLPTRSRQQLKLQFHEISIFTLYREVDDLIHLPALQKIYFINNSNPKDPDHMQHPDKQAYTFTPIPLQSHVKSKQFQIRPSNSPKTQQATSHQYPSRPNLPKSHNFQSITYKILATSKASTADPRNH